MGSTVVAVFDDQQAAERARHEVLHAGFSYANVVIHSGGGRTGSAMDGQSTVQEDHGGIGGWFRSLFNLNEDDQDAGLYAEAVRRGHCVLSVHVNDDEETARAERILQGCGPVDFDERARQPERPETGGATTMGLTAPAAGSAATSAEVSADDARATVPVVQEALQVGKREVRGGGLRVFTRLVETPVSETVRLRQERATVERRPVDRPATEADLAASKDGSVEVRETSEEAVVSKTARVTEEIAVGKQATEREQVIRDTVRHTDVQVERIEGSVQKAGGKVREDSDSLKGDPEDR